MTGVIEQKRGFHQTFRIKNVKAENGTVRRDGPKRGEKEEEEKQERENGVSARALRRTLLNSSPGSGAGRHGGRCSLQFGVAGAGRAGTAGWVPQPRGDAERGLSAARLRHQRGRGAVSAPPQPVSSVVPAPERRLAQLPLLSFRGTALLSEPSPFPGQSLAPGAARGCCIRRGLPSAIHAGRAGRVLL